MCGIAGIVRFDDEPIERPRLEAMLKQIRHRGPDGEGIWENGRCALVHTRLSILDPIGGEQPMHLRTATEVDRTDLNRTSYGPLHLIFNGEIYNHRPLRRRLESLGHRFRSDHSDTEVLLIGFSEWGMAVADRLEGMYALAIWDEANRRLHLARDRSGKKPLFVQHTGREVRFGSLVGTLVVASPPKHRPVVNSEAMLTFLRLGYVFDQSLIDGIQEVPAAHWMTIDPKGQMTLHRYWPTEESVPEAAHDHQSLPEVLFEAVGKRMEADVPLGCFLSGGIDSALVAAMAQRHLSQRGANRLRTFNVAMPHIDYDESPHARMVARHIGSQHTVLQAEPTDAIADLRHLMATTGEPTADSSLLPMFWLCKATRQWVYVALSGDGGDEFFGGYDRYRALRLLAGHRWWLQYGPAGLLNHTNPMSWQTRLCRLIEAAQAGPDPSGQYRRMIHLFTDDQLQELGFDGSDNRPGSDSEADGPGRHERSALLPDWPAHSDRLSAAMVWDQTHYLPHDLLRKVDRASMAVALEVRCPLLDRCVCELAGRLTPATLMPRGRPKSLLRDVAARLGLPPPIVSRPKHGFAIPLGHWFRTSMKDGLADLLFDGDLQALGFDTKAVRRYFEAHSRSEADHSHRLFALLQLVLWSHWLKEPALPKIGID